jgi:tetratricopeptide (TPR) repeat protein
VRLNARWPKAHYRRGLALRALGSLPDAAAAFQRSLELDPALKDVSAAPHPPRIGFMLTPSDGRNRPMRQAEVRVSRASKFAPKELAVHDLTMNSDGADRPRRRWRRWSA